MDIKYMNQNMNFHQIYHQLCQRMNLKFLADKVNKNQIQLQEFKKIIIKHLVK